MSKDELIQIAIDGGLRLRHIDSYREKRGLTRAAVFNSLALLVANRFNAQSLSYEDADSAINLVWHAMVSDSIEQGEGSSFANPAYAIYEAFDEGEYDHGDGEDPIETYTKPRIKEILKNA